MALLLFGGCNPSSPPGQGGEPGRLDVLFLGDPSQMHNSTRFAPMLTTALAPERIDVTYTTELTDLNPGKLRAFDALLVYCRYPALTPEQEAALVGFVEAGGGLVAVHSASDSFRSSEAWVTLVGAQFQSHGAEEFTAEIVKPGHPILEGIEPFRVWDETYVHAKLGPDRTVLMERVNSAGREPWSWVRTQGSGRVFYTAYGHGEPTWSHPSFQRLLANAIRWTTSSEAGAGDG